MLATERSALWVVMDRVADLLKGTSQSTKPRQVLLLLDQFEEIFSGVHDSRAVDQFVALISEFFRRPHPQLYLVLTMRTDFIGQCANFPGLAEILNTTQYITPVLRGQDLADAIVRPAETYWGEVEPALVTAIVRDMGAGTSYDADHLPLMQHALLWMWQQAWPATGLAEPPNPGMSLPDGTPKAGLTLALYREHGGLHGILNRHADAILGRIASGPGGERRAAIAEAMFRRLSERDASLRYKRAPAYAGDVCRIVHCAVDELNEVIDPFSGADASFVERRRETEPGNPLLDLSHESLIRQWETLRAWADSEAEKLEVFRRVADDAEGWVKAGKSSEYLREGAKLGVLEEWWGKNRPTLEWAIRYNAGDGMPGQASDDLPLVEEFRSASVRARRRGRRLRIASAIAAVIAVLAVMGVVQRIRLESRVQQLQVKAEAAQQELQAKAEAAQAALQARADTLRFALTRLIGRDIDRNRPSEALQLALTFLADSGGAGNLGPEEKLADQALQNLHEIGVLKPGGLVFSVDYSPDGKWLLASGLSQPVLWTAGWRTYQPLHGLGQGQYWRVVWNPRGGQVLLSSQSQQTVLMPVNPVGPEPTLDPDAAISLADGRDEVGFGVFSGDGSKVVTSSIGSPLRVWDAKTGTLLAKAGGASDGSFWFAVNADGTLIAMADPQGVGAVRVYKVDGGAITLLPDPRNGLSRLAPHRNQNAGDSCDARGPAAVPALAFGPANPRLLVFGLKCDAYVVDVLSGDLLLRLRGSDARIDAVAFSRDGTRIATGAEDGEIRIYRSPVPDGGNAPNAADDIDPDFVFGEHTSGVFGLSFSPDGKHLASAGGHDQTVRVWSIRPVVSREPHFGDLGQRLAFGVE